MRFCAQEVLKPRLKRTDFWLPPPLHIYFTEHTSDFFRTNFRNAPKKLFRGKKKLTGECRLLVIVLRQRSSFLATPVRNVDFDVLKFESLESKATAQNTHGVSSKQRRAR